MEKNDFLIPLNGLPQGLTEYKGLADKEFFGKFGNEDILDAKVNAGVSVEKSGQFIGVDCEMSGEVTVECDRCLEPLTLPVDVCAKLSIKYGSESAADSEDDEAEREVVYLSEKDADLDMAQTVYDYICLSLPFQRIHKEGECNPQVLKYIEDGIKIAGSSDDDENPFSVLNGMFKE